MLSNFLLAVWVCLVVGAGNVLAQSHEPAPQAPAAAGAHDAHDGPAGHGAKRTLEMSASDFFKHRFEHSVPYVIFTPKISPDEHVNHLFAVYNEQPWQWVCLGLMFVVFLPVVGSLLYKTKTGQIWMVGGAVWMLIGIFVMKMMINFKI